MPPAANRAHDGPALPRRRNSLSKILAALFTAVVVVIAAPALAQGRDAGPTALAQRSGELLAILNGGGDPQSTFAPNFLRDVPERQLREVAASVREQLGRATGIASVTPHGQAGADLLIRYERGTAHATLVLAPGGGQVIGFTIDGLVPADIASLRTLDDVAGVFARLPGEVRVAVSDIAAGSEAKVALDADRPLAIASTFKLVVLAELVRAIDAGERNWTDTVTLGAIELPAGGFNQMPRGTKVTLRRLAEEMIRVSDNSATDLLLHELGRRRVEGMLAPLGFRYADWNVPLLSTLELFKLKGAQGGAWGRRFLESDPLERGACSMARWRKCPAPPSGRCLPMAARC